MTPGRFVAVMRRVPDPMTGRQGWQADGGDCVRFDMARPGSGRQVMSALREKRPSLKAKGKFRTEATVANLHTVAILGASGYTGAELVRLLATHPGMTVGVLTADRKAGMEMGEVFPHLRHLDLPPLQRIDEAVLTDVALVFCALPHGTSRDTVTRLGPEMRIVDLSADFRLRDANAYQQWYGLEPLTSQTAGEAVYGLTEFYRESIRTARLVAGTGCNAATGLLPVLPLLESEVIDPDEIVIDLATGVSGAGRTPNEGILHAEVSEGFQPYNPASHRHIAEFEQEFSRVAGRPVSVSFVPHLLPQNRGILATVYVKGDPNRIHSVLSRRYHDEPFVIVLPMGETPSTRHVRGSNWCHIGVVRDRPPGRAILFSALDNLLKGAAGQAVQNANLMLGLPETMGLEAPPLFP